MYTNCTKTATKSTKTKQAHKDKPKQEKGNKPKREDKRQVIAFML